MGLRSSTREVIDDIIPISRKYLRKLHRFKWLSSSFSQKDLKGYIWKDSSSVRPTTQ